MPNAWVDWSDAKKIEQKILDVDADRSLLFFDENLKPINEKLDYLQCGDSLILTIKRPDGTFEQYDCKVRRYRSST